jgi:hypothetical protein
VYSRKFQLLIKLCADNANSKRNIQLPSRRLSIVNNTENTLHERPVPYAIAHNAIIPSPQQFGMSTTDDIKQ